MTVDEFIAARVQPELRDVVQALRMLIHSHAPSATESIRYGIPAYAVREIIAVISPTKKDITLSFSHGAEFEDRYGLLRGVGKVSKHVKFKSVKEIKPAALRYYIKQALALDKA